MPLPKMPQNVRSAAIVSTRICEKARERPKFAKILPTRRGIRLSPAPPTLVVLLLGLLAGCAAQPGAIDSSRHPAPSFAPARAYLLHLPGIGGEMWLDRNLIAGLRDGD